MSLGKAQRAASTTALPAAWTRARRAGWTEALHAEWTKARTLPGTPWLLLGVVALSTATSTVAAAVSACPTAQCDLDPARIGLGGIQLGQLLVAILAVTAIGGEYSTGTIAVSFAAIPRRPVVLAAKAAVLSGLVLAAGTVTMLFSLVAGERILARNGVGPDHGLPALWPADATVARAAAGSVLYLALVGLLSLGVATALRDSATSIGTVLGLLYLFPILASVITDPGWHRRLQQVGPMTAGLAVQATTGRSTLPIGPWPGLGVLAGWAGAALLAGLLSLRVRDA